MLVRIWGRGLGIGLWNQVWGGGLGKLWAGAAGWYSLCEGTLEGLSVDSGMCREAVPGTMAGNPGSLCHLEAFVTQAFLSPLRGSSAKVTLRKSPLCPLHASAYPLEQEAGAAAEVLPV